jgi:hypothetical protein
MEISQDTHVSQCQKVMGALTIFSLLTFCLQIPGNIANPFSSSVGEVAGFSLHAGVATKANERMKLERLCRYITRPAVSARISPV